MKIYAPALFCLFYFLSAHATEALRILSWPGYVSANAIKQFSQQYQIDVEVTIINNDDELWEKANQSDAPPYDLITLNTAELKRYIDADLLLPLQINRIPNSRKQSPRFRKLESIPGIMHEGKVYALPYTYSAMGLIYNRKLVKEAPTSMTALWDPSYHNKVLAHDSSAHNFSLSALTQGFKNPFRLNNNEFSKVVNHLAKLRLNVFKFYDSPEEALALFQNNDIALIYANYGTQQIQMLRNAGADIGYIIPQEGALAWLDCWAVMRSAARSPQRSKLAEAWINQMLSEANSHEFTRLQGLPNTRQSEANDAFIPKNAHLIWLQPVEDPQKRADYWARLLSNMPEKR